ncbi:hypothetical protein MKW98_008924 [Papaver atlanticum]|uniref:Transcription factor GTE4 n=1 Tax=Papaver atlanticum TaxID=357466 RepID=A0AAD4S252_9MAGN|nr:hypothetical protein MKW98_008924 [Papaver atlanticum]
MASGPLVGGGEDGSTREKHRWAAESKVYTRKFHHKGVKTTVPPPPHQTLVVTQEGNSSQQQQQPQQKQLQEPSQQQPQQQQDQKEQQFQQEQENQQEHKNQQEEQNQLEQQENQEQQKLQEQQEQPEEQKQQHQKEHEEKQEHGRQLEQGEQPEQIVTRLDAASDDSSSLNHKQTEVIPEEREPILGNGCVPTTGTAIVSNGIVRSSPAASVDNDRVTINLSSSSKLEIRDLRRKLNGELEQVRSLKKRLEAKGAQVGVGGYSNPHIDIGDYSNPQIGVGGYSNSHLSANVALDNGGGVKRTISEAGSVGVHQGFRPLLSVSVFENTHTGVADIVEKRTPKANQYYRNSEFLLAKDKFPPSESRKSKSGGGKKHHGSGDGGSHGFGIDKYSSQAFRSCSSLLSRLMKHKHGWVFNSPVDVKKLGLHDYYLIIKHPMDLGTVKSKLNMNRYKSPREFAEDVRLTFSNAMIYNPKGQDVHFMAEQLLQIFEERWAVLETEFNPEARYQIDYEMGLPTPTSKRTPYPPFSTELGRTLDRSESITHPFADSKLKPSNSAPMGRTPVLKKPKAKDPNKRNMTFEEKQKLSTHLQNLPSAKLDNIVQIIKKRNSSLNQHDDEIEVDIDSVDAETLWELDRFVTNYKKSLSKNKRKAELAMQAREEAQRRATKMDISPAPAPASVEAPKEARTEERNVASQMQGEKQGDDGNRSSSSSSSSSDSGSSSSDSDSESSSASEGGHSPKT